MSPRSVEEIVSDYYTAMQQACMTGKLSPAKLHFSGDIVIVDPNHRTEGRQEVLKMYEEKLLPNLERLVIHHQFFDKSSCCTIFDNITKMHREPVPTVAWIKVRNGEIYEVQVFYDSPKWHKNKVAA